MTLLSGLNQVKRLNWPKYISNIQSNCFTLPTTNACVKRNPILSTSRPINPPELFGTYVLLDMTMSRAVLCMPYKGQKVAGGWEGAGVVLQ